MSPPENWKAILYFHDCVELFLLACAVHVDASVRDNASISQIWDAIEEKVLPFKLAQRTAINRLIKSRVNFKHYFSIPSNEQIIEFKYTVNIFLEENCKNILNVAFPDISSIYLVNDDEFRQEFLSAEEFAFNKNFSEAFRILDEIWDHYARAGVFKGNRDRSLLDVDSADESIVAMVNEVEHSLYDLHNSIYVVSLGFSKTDFDLFRWILEVEARQDISTCVGEKEYRFCRDFLVNFVNRVHMMEGNILED